jgi:excisionase family DNA binding protein
VRSEDRDDGVKNSPEAKRIAEARDTIEQVLAAVADAIAERIDRRQQARRRLLDMEQTCEYLGVSEDGVYRLVSDRKLTPVNVDRRRRFDIRDLDKLIEAAKKW